MELREMLARRSREFRVWFKESGAEESLKALVAAIGESLGKLAEWNLAISPLEQRAWEELRRGRDEFVIEVDAAGFPEAGPADYETITYMVEAQLVERLPVRCTEVRHADETGRSSLSFERIPTPEPSQQLGAPS